jgi:hypothetical protein
MFIIKELLYNNVTSVDLRKNRLVNDEWSVLVAYNQYGNLSAFVDEDELEEEDSEDIVCDIYVVDDEHQHIVPEWLVDHYENLMLTQSSMDHMIEEQLTTSIIVDAVEYHIFVDYSAD